MNQNIKLAILGGSGKTGKPLVRGLLSRGYKLKVLLRKPDEFFINHPLIQVIHGDAIDSNIINELVDGCQGVISTIGQREGEPLIASNVVCSILHAMEHHGVNRLISLAGINIDSPGDEKGNITEAATQWMKVNYEVPHYDKQKAFDLLLASDVDWTLVRVPLIHFNDLNGSVLVSSKDCQGSYVDVYGIVNFVIGLLRDNSFVRMAPFIWSSDA